MLQTVNTGEAASWADGDPENRDRVGRRSATSDRMRLTVLLAVFGLRLLAPKAVLAQQAVQKNMIGRRVVQRSNDLALHIENRVVDRGRALHFYRVEQASGPWLWVRAEGNGLSGWALADHVIPVEEGIGFFTDQMRQDSQDVFPYVMRAMLWQEEHQVANALKDYDEALRLDSTRAWIFNDRGILHFEQKDYDKALADFDQAIQLEPENASYFNNRGTVRRIRKLFDLATTDFNQAVRLNPTYAYAYYNRGLTRADNKEYDQAIADFNEVVRLDPQEPMAFYHRGLAWLSKEQWDSAIADFDRASGLNDKLNFVYVDRGRARAAKKEYLKSLEDYDTGIRLAPQRPRAYYHRGLAHVELKEYDRAMADFDTAIRLDPRFDEAYLSRAWLLASCPDTKFRDPKKAVESATRACELTNWHEAHDLGGLAAVYAETGNVAAALKWQSKAIELMTGDEKTKVKNDSFVLGHP